MQNIYKKFPKYEKKHNFLINPTNNMNCFYISGQRDADTFVMFHGMGDEFHWFMFTDNVQDEILAICKKNIKKD